MTDIKKPIQESIGFWAIKIKMTYDDEIYSRMPPCSSIYKEDRPTLPWAAE
jgi:hypothetical protein